MNLLMRAIFSLLLLFTLSIPVISDCVAMAIESRFKYMMLLFKMVFTCRHPLKTGGCR
ncbi:TPA: hypothetical protein IGQ68_001997 [Escherichia coli]|nr:hypothetical protein [Escherichia coli]HAN9493839.1 hypothetical protein [Escherichia coli]